MPDGDALDAFGNAAAGETGNGRRFVIEVDDARGKSSLQAVLAGQRAVQTARPGSDALGFGGQPSPEQALRFAAMVRNPHVARAIGNNPAMAQAIVRNPALARLIALQAAAVAMPGRRGPRVQNFLGIPGLQYASQGIRYGDVRLSRFGFSINQNAMLAGYRLGAWALGANVVGQTGVAAARGLENNPEIAGRAAIGTLAAGPAGGLIGVATGGGIGVAAKAAASGAKQGLNTILDLFGADKFAGLGVSFLRNITAGFLGPDASIATALKDADEARKVMLSALFGGGIDAVWEHQRQKQNERAAERLKIKVDLKRQYLENQAKVVTRLNDLYPQDTESQLREVRDQLVKGEMEARFLTKDAFRRPIWRVATVAANAGNP